MARIVRHSLPEPIPAIPGTKRARYAVENNFIIVKSIRIRQAKIPIHLRTLNNLLNNLEVPKKIISSSQNPDGCQIAQRGETFSSLWDRYEIAKKTWMDKIKTHHPDRGGNAEYAATLNATWKEIKKRFAKRGIGTYY
jgi:hypothetical protein